MVFIIIAILTTQKRYITGTQLIRSEILELSLEHIGYPRYYFPFHWNGKCYPQAVPIFRIAM